MKSLLGEKLCGNDDMKYGNIYKMYAAILFDFFTKALTIIYKHIRAECK